MRYKTLTEELFDEVNHMFANFDVSFRDAESRLGLRNVLPYVTVPGVKTYSRYEDVRTYDDGEKAETYKNGRLHGEVRYHDSKTPSEYFIEGRQVAKEKWDAYVIEKEENRTHVIYIDNKPYEVTGKQLKQLKETLQSITKIEKK